jgi:hypothetical protein
MSVNVSLGAAGADLRNFHEEEIIVKMTAIIYPHYAYAPTSGRLK